MAIAALLGLLLLHLWWSRRHSALLQKLRAETARLEAESRSSLEQAQARQQAVFNSMAEGVLLLDEQARVQWANLKFIQFFGLGDDVRGRTVLEATRSHELAELTESVRLDSQLINRTLRLPGPQQRHVDVNAVPIIGRQGKSQGMVLVLHDISQLRRLERTREEFVANVSHELRTPLSLIKGYAETLLDDTDKDPEVVKRFLRTIDRNARRLQFLIEDLLAISALESGRVEMERRPVALQEVSSLCLEDYQPAAGLRHTRFEVDVPDVQVNVDPERMEQVIGNLLDNAIKYGREGGRIRISADMSRDQWVEVAIQDDGPGIPSDALDRVFERFFRVDKARSREQGGTGLGLSIVKHIVQGHGGQVYAESELGQGAVICFTIPLADSSG